jgi:hypothetical protein
MQAKSGDARNSNCTPLKSIVEILVISNTDDFQTQQNEAGEYDWWESRILREKLENRFLSVHHLDKTVALCGFVCGMVDHHLLALYEHTSPLKKLTWDPTDFSTVLRMLKEEPPDASWRRSGGDRIHWCAMMRTMMFAKKDGRLWTHAFLACKLFCHNSTVIIWICLSLPDPQLRPCYGDDYIEWNKEYDERELGRQRGEAVPPEEPLTEVDFTQLTLQEELYSSEEECGEDDDDDEGDDEGDDDDDDDDDDDSDEVDDIVHAKKKMITKRRKT